MEEEAGVDDLSTEERSEVSAGLARAAIRQVTAAGGVAARQFGKANIGSLPRKLPTKAVGQLTDRLGKAYDVWSSLQHGQAQSGKLQEKTWEARKRAVKLLLRHSLPNFLHNAALGTVLFVAYEDLADRLQQSSLCSGGYLATAGWSSAAGATAGVTHGVVAGAYTSAADRKLVPNPGGLVLSHAIAHGTLFSAYELSKRAAMEYLQADYRSYEGAAAVVAAGAIAGSLQEAVAHYTLQLETMGIRGGWRAVRSVSAPSLRMLGSAAPGSALGFVAFEYGREIVSRQDK